MKPDLKLFLENKMRMSHIYQPVMIWTLLSRGGRTSIKDIAQEIAGHDQALIEYYEERVKMMVGKVLIKNNIISKPTKTEYELSAEYSSKETSELLKICEDKIAEFIEQRNTDIWEHRRNARRPVPGSVRYNVLKRAKFKCELCGIDAEVRSLEVDHIIPKSLGGLDSEDNYQALCYRCNTNKGNRDDQDFRGVAESYQIRYGDCLFCKRDEVILENELAIAFYDKYPVTNGHMLIIPKRHCNDYFELFQPELNAINRLLREVKVLLEKKDKTIQGYNIGWNSGEVAGQTIMHAHVHIIPRRIADSTNPEGGVRGVIPAQQKYSR